MLLLHYYYYYYCGSRHFGDYCGTGTSFYLHRIHRIFRAPAQLRKLSSSVQIAIDFSIQLVAELKLRTNQRDFGWNYLNSVEFLIIRQRSN